MEFKMSDNKYEQEFTDEGFWDKAKNFAKAAGESVIEPALKLYYSANDPDTPVWAKTTAYGALGYFISPIDAIPDLTPVVGFSDDLGVLVAAIAAIAVHVKDVHAKEAKETLRKWFD